ncbi:MAG: hypothetical protein EDM05_020825 [Leptolyngbya sp. IPPAS B-1204]|nr:hypothetical protein [Elainella sp. C42_A2020_010]
MHGWACPKSGVTTAERFSTVQSADQILVLDQGQIVQQGTHDSLINQDGMYRRFWHSRQQAKTWKLGSNRVMFS